MSEKEADTTRRRVAVGGAAAGVVAVVVAVVVWQSGGPEGDATTEVTDPPAPPSMSATPTPSDTSSPDEPAPDGGTGDPSAPAESGSASPRPGATLAPVPLDDPAPYGDGVTARVVSTEAVTARANGPGEIDGPAVAFTIELTNRTGEPLDVDGATVNAYYSDDVPASSVTSDRRTRPLAGTVAPGRSTRGTYVFSVPRGQRDQLRLEVSHAAVSPIAVFRGPAG